MVALLCKQMKIAEAHPVKVTMKDPKTQRAATEEVPVLLPHVLFSKLSGFFIQRPLKTFLQLLSAKLFGQVLRKPRTPG